MCIRWYMNQIFILENKKISLKHNAIQPHFILYTHTKNIHFYHFIQFVFIAPTWKHVTMKNTLPYFIIGCKPEILGINSDEWNLKRRMLGNLTVSCWYTLIYWKNDSIEETDSWMFVFFFFQNQILIENKNVLCSIYLSNL